MDAEVPYTKWRRRRHTVNPSNLGFRQPQIISILDSLNPQLQNLGIGRADYIVAEENNPSIGGPAQFKSMLVKGQFAYVLKYIILKHERTAK